MPGRERGNREMKRRLTLRGRLVLGTVAMAVVLAAPLLLSMRSLRNVHRTTLELRNGPFAAQQGRKRAVTQVERRPVDVAQRAQAKAPEARREPRAWPTFRARAAPKVRRGSLAVAPVRPRAYSIRLPPTL